MEKKTWNDFSQEERQNMDDIAFRLTGRTISSRKEEMIKGSLKAVEEKKNETQPPKSEAPPKKSEMDFKEEFPTVNRKIADLRDACQMAEWFDENKVDSETYAIKEGWDLFDVIHSLVVLFRAWKVLLSRAKENSS